MAAEKTQFSSVESVVRLLPGTDAASAFLTK
jgi:hypothetical protein